MQKAKSKSNELELGGEAVGNVNISNSDIELTKHAAEMMLRRGVNSNTLANTVYSPNYAVEVEDMSLGVVKYKSHEGNRDIEAVCIFVHNIYSKSYKIRIITVHTSKQQQIRR
ncbi:MAG: hypothetical protein ACP5MZ_04310 [Candidatus Micrarchaeia archaeon]